MADEKRTIPMRFTEPGAEGEDSVYPQLIADGRIRLAPEDGDTILAFEARLVSHYLWTLKFGVTVAHTINMGRPEEITTRLFTVRGIVTDARVAYVVFDKKDPRYVVGQVRYQWLDGVGFHPKESFILDPELELQFTQDFPLADRGLWTHRIVLGFDKSVHPGSLAVEILHRAARFRLADGGPKDAREELERLIKLQSLPDPGKKGEFASVVLPGAARFPVFDYPAAEGAPESDLSDAVTEAPIAVGVGESSRKPEPSPLRSAQPILTEIEHLPRIRIGDRIRAAHLLARAQRDFAANRDGEAAIRFDAVLAIIDAHHPVMSTAQLLDILQRCAFAHLPGNNAVAITRIKRAIALAQEQNDEAMERGVRVVARELLDGVPEHELVLPNLRRLVELADILGTRAERAEERVTLARQCLSAGLRSESIEHFAAAAELFDAAGETWEAAMAFAQLGDVYRSVGDLGARRTAIKRARSGFEKAGDAANVAIATQILLEIDA